MKTTKWMMTALLGIGMAMPVAQLLSTSARASEDEVTGEATDEIRPDRRDKHNKQWRKAKIRARETARRGNAKDVVRDFKKELDSPDIVINLCIVNVIADAENVAVNTDDANQVINIINVAMCEIQ
jgi:hypothetical protein